MEDPKKIILKTEYSNKFDEIRKDLVVQSYFKYGKASRNFVSGYVDAIGSLKKCIQKFEETGNLEYLADAANYCMFRYMYPQGDEYFMHTDSNESAGIVGMSVKEIEEFKKENTTPVNEVSPDETKPPTSGAVASAVMACKATTKLSDILDDSRDRIDSIHDVIENPDKVNEEYTQDDGNKDLAIVYTQTALKVAKVYAPAVILGGLSITAILTSNNILRKRNIALAAAYTAVDKSFKEYRGRVVERFGKELDKELRYNIKAKEVEETVTDEKGNEKTVKKTVDVVDPNAISEFAKFFDDGCIGWTKDPELNMIFLRQQEAAATKRLEDRGHLFLNEVYDMLGIPHTRAGQIVGWIYDKKNPIGDNYVDFGIYDTSKEANRNFVNGYERTILLDFNVDGNILDLM